MRRILLFLVAAAALPGPAGAQSPEAAPGTEERRTVAAGPQYEAGGFHRFWFGDGYRDLWTTPVEVPVLDLQGTAGGLTPVRVVGQAQGLGLAFKSADGRAYTFRSLHKHPERMLPEEWRDHFPGKLAQDQSSHTHPAAGQILAPLFEVAGVAHTTPRLTVMPDDPALGEFRKTFAGEFGTIGEFPLPAGDGRPGFMGATEIISTSDLWESWLSGPENRIDSRALLRARVVDLWLDNFDRHRGQWRWMRLPDHELWQPLPEDPDMVLVHHDGILMMALRGRIPKELKFSEKYPGKLEGPLTNCFEVDRWLLSDLDAAAWREVASDLQGRFTDEVIEGALRRMPPEWYAIDGEHERAQLETRRDGLVDYVMRVYRYYAKKVDVHATDQPETVTLARGSDDSMEITIAVEGGEPWYRRRFLPDETDEVRVYLHAGDDRVTRTGAPGGPITVRVIAGGGRDVVDDSQSGGTDVWRDAGAVDVSRGSGTQVRGGTWTNPAPVEDAPWLEPRSYGHLTNPNVILAYHPDIELVMGYGLTRRAWGFRTEPLVSIQTLRAAVSTGAGTGKVEYGGTFRSIGSGKAFRFEAFASDIEQYNFFGYGNETEYPYDPTDPNRPWPPTELLRYRAEETVLFASPTFRLDIGRRFEAFIGPEVRYSETGRDDGTIIGYTFAYGTADFGQVALRGGLHFDSRRRPEAGSGANIAEGIGVGETEPAQTSGVNVQVEGFYMPELWDVVLGDYGGVDGVLNAYAGTKHVHLAARVGGRMLWGNTPWFEAAAIGGWNNRGFHARRFTGDSSLFGSVEARGWLGHLPLPLLPTRVGLVAFADGGRVWLDQEESNTWHASYGGGLLLQPVLAPITAHVLAAHSTEGTRFYFGLGYPF